MRIPGLVICLIVMVPVVSGGSVTLLTGELMDLSVGEYASVRFVLPQHQSDSARISGSIEITPDSSCVELILLHIDDYLRWRDHGAQADTLGYLRMYSGPFTVDVPGFGSMVLVVSNRGNYQPASVLISADILFAGSGSTGDPLPAALKLALLVMMAAAVAFAVGSVLARRAAGRRRRT